MPQGPGKYDGVLTAARERLSAPGAFPVSAALIVLDGPFGPGFSCQMTPDKLLLLPVALRQMADEIEASLGEGRL